MFRARFTFHDHTPEAKREQILASLTCLGEKRRVADRAYEFAFSRVGKAERARILLRSWSSEGWLDSRELA